MKAEEMTLIERYELEVEMAIDALRDAVNGWEGV